MHKIVTDSDYFVFKSVFWKSPNYVQLLECPFKSDDANCHNNLVILILSLSTNANASVC